MSDNTEKKTSNVAFYAFIGIISVSFIGIILYLLYSVFFG